MPMTANCADKTSAMPSRYFLAAWKMARTSPQTANQSSIPTMTFCNLRVEKRNATTIIQTAGRAESNCLFSIDQLKGEFEVCHDASVNAAMDLGGFP